MQPNNEQEKKSFKERIWTPLLSPIVSLVAICLVTSFLLGLTNDITEPIIEANTLAVADETRQEMLTDADAFEAVELPEDGPDNVTSVYKATNGAGYVIEAFGRGYGGDVPAMVAFDADGNILSVRFLSNDETPGLGKNIETDADFSGQFAGLPPDPIKAESIDMLASSTVSCTAALDAVNAAIEMYDLVAFGLHVDGGAGATKEVDADAADDTANEEQEEGATGS